ncbi:MAG: GntR family transcriptional regulator [Desulfobacteria bacterium]
MQPLKEKGNPFDLRQYAGHRPVGELVHLAMRRAILERVLPPGQRLVIKEMAFQMGVSLTPVREAIRKLELEGLVRNEPYRGSVVIDLPSMEEMEEFYYLRGALEGLVAHYAVRRSSRAQLAELRAALDKMGEAADVGDVGLFMELQVDFWDRYIGLARNTRLFQLVSSIRDYMEQAKPISLSFPGRVTESIREIRAVVDAVEAGDSDRAESLAREHCRLACKAYLAVMERRAAPHTEEGRP